jgi:DNA primase
MITLSRSEVAAYYALRAPDLRQHGKRWRGRCPIHSGKHDNFTVDSETGLWRCWSGCGRGGDVTTMEMALTNMVWRDAVKAIEEIIGRPLLKRPASQEERRALAQRLARERQDLRAAETWQIAIVSMMEDVLDRLPEAAPERYAPTQLLLRVRPLQGSALLALFRDSMARKPRLTAGLVYAGARARQRQCDRLARFIVAGSKVNDEA